MPGSPLKKNYVHEIKASNLDQIILQPIKKQKTRKHKTGQIQIMNGCIREKILPFDHEKNPNDYFELVMYQSGIFNINKVHKSSIKLSQVKKNIKKECIPIEQRNLKSLFLFPTQTIVQCQYNIQNKFHKQMIYYCPGEYLIINNFSNGKMDKEQFNFNLRDLILVKTVFSKDKLISVKDYSLAGQVQYFGQDEPLHSNLKVRLQKYFVDKEFCKMIYKMTEGLFDWLQPISHGSQASTYFGRLSINQNLPDGIGLLVNRKPPSHKAKSISEKSSIKNQNEVPGFEFFFGIFRGGLLDVIGEIWFRDKSTYYGQFQNGSFNGIGQYFSLKAGMKKGNMNPYESFQFKDGVMTISRPQFFNWIKQGYFNGNKGFSNQDTIGFIQNQYEKLRKIYAIPKKRQQSSPEVEQVKNTKTSEIRNSQQIDDFGDQFGRASFSQGKKTPKMGDTNFRKKQNMKDIFDQIRVTNPKNQRKNDSKMDKKIPEFDRTKTTPYERHHNQITTRSDDHAYNFMEKKTSTQTSNKKQKQIIKSALKRFQNQEVEFDQSFRQVNGWSDQRMEGNRMIDSNYDDADSSYLRNKEAVSTIKYHNEPDYIQKQYPFENPKNFRVPDYFIVQNERAHMKLDTNSIKANVVRQGRTKKNEYISPPRVKKEAYLSPNQKDNEMSIKKYEHALSTNRSKKIFYNPPK